MQPSLVLASVPDSVLGSEHPAPPLVVEHGEVAYRDPEGARLQVPCAALLDEMVVTNLRVSERIDGHAESMAFRTG